MSTKVAVRAVTKRFGTFHANRAIDLEIRAGELLTLLGPSGCGKTTLMRIIAGLEQADEGSVHIDGRDVSGLPPRRRRLGMVFQSYSLFPHLTVRENIAYGLEVQRLPRDRIDARVRAMLELVRLPELADRRPAALSGGQQQRVALARALATEPSLLMLDEPLAALDLKLRRQMQAELKRIHRATGVTILFVTHDQEEALFLSDRVAVMRDGRIEQIDTPQNVYARPASAFVAEFIGDVTLLDGAGALALRGTHPAAEMPAGARLVVRPEHVRIVGEAAEGSPATVEEIVNEGSTTLLLLRADDAPLKARVLGRPALERGARVYVAIDRECAWIHA